MATQIATHIELRKNRDGEDRAFIAGTRVRVQDVYALAEVHGMNADQIVEQLPHLSLGQVHAALSYYYDHRVEIQEEIRQDNQFAKLMQSRTGPGPFSQFISGRLRAGVDRLTDEGSQGGPSS